MTAELNETYTYKVDLSGDRAMILDSVWSAFIAEDLSLRLTDKQGLIIAAFVTGAWVSVARLPEVAVQ